MSNIRTSPSGWWLGLFPIYGKIQNVPNHQPVMICYTVSRKRSNKFSAGMECRPLITNSLVKPYLEFPVNAHVGDLPASHVWWQWRAIPSGLMDETHRPSALCGLHNYIGFVQFAWENTKSKGFEHSFPIKKRCNIKCIVYIYICGMLSYMKYDMIHV